MNHNRQEKPITGKQIQLIHIAKGQLGLDDGTYRALLDGYGAESSKDLTCAQADQLIDDFKAKGFRIVSRHPRPRRRSQGKNVVHLASQQEIDKVNAVAGLIRWRAQGGLPLFLEKRLHIKDGRVRTAGDAYRAIEALKKLFEHQMEASHGPKWWTIRFEDEGIEEYTRRHAPAEFCDALGRVYKRDSKVF
ncbi:MAG TPA: phage protein GemA/Gp16 family protein, partial [Geothermobacteraceae bacterium]|nr:phage protein GemA/Gp16 family protein [Geothermobacteraceae bacterium]